MNKEKNKTKQNPKPKIFYLAFGYGIKAQIVKIKKRFFYTKRMAFLSTFVFLLVGSTLFFSLNYMAKGASYGWLQASWIGGVLSNQTTCEAEDGTWDATNSVCVATHTDNKEDWTAYSEKDDNVDVTTTSGEMTLSSGSSEVEHTTSAQFDSGTKSGFMQDSVTVSDQVTADFKYFNAVGVGACTGFKGVYYVDSVSATWANALTTCTSLCPTCELPTLTELTCMCTNKASFGNNFIASRYWSATEFNSTLAYAVNFSNCAAYLYFKTFAANVRCVRR